MAMSSLTYNQDFSAIFIQQIMQIRHSQTCSERSPYKTGDSLISLKFSLTGQEKGDILIQMAA